MAKPLQNIAISLSGGGYRAAAFHLGSLSLLHSVKYGYPEDQNQNKNRLVDKITILSTISGGTITGVKYAHSCAKGDSFQTFFQEFYYFLKEDDLLGDALYNINHLNDWNNYYKNRNLINAFSEIYNTKLLQASTFETLLVEDKGIEEVIFNATDLVHGLPFRFQNHGRFGNKKISCQPKEAKEVLLGDIVATSSCFPGGFEPMIFPKDYLKESDPLHSKWLDKYKEGTALMDGGIIDNQGLKGITTAANRLHNKGKSISTLIISDVEGKNVKSYAHPESFKHKWWSNFEIGTIDKWMTYIFLLSSIGTIVLLRMHYHDQNYTLVLIIFLLTVLLSISGSFILLYNKVKIKIKNLIETTLDDTHGNYWKKLLVAESTPMYMMADLLLSRANSLSVIIQDVFLKNNRRNMTKEVYSNDEWREKTIYNSIYRLNGKSETLGSKWTEIINTANEMPTTLWFTESHVQLNMLEKLIQCGQITLCFQIKEHVEGIINKDDFSEYDESDQNLVRELFNQLDQLLEALKENPRLILEQLLGGES